MNFTLKASLIGCLSFLSSCIGKIERQEAWYILSFQKRESECISSIMENGFNATPEFLLKNTRYCYVQYWKDGKLIVDCSREPSLRGVLYFAIDKESCEDLKRSLEII